MHQHLLAGPAATRAPCQAPPFWGWLSLPGKDSDGTEQVQRWRPTSADQAALYGVLAQLESLGLELIEVRRLPSA